MNAGRAPRRPSPDRLLLAAIVLLLVWGLLITVTGGIDLRPGGLRLSSRDPSRPAILALVLLLFYVLRYREQASAQIAWLAALEERRALVSRLAPLLAAGLAVGVLAIGLACATYVAGGADAYGYISQSKLWLAGSLTQPQPFVRGMPWPNLDWTFAPLGYRPAPSGGALVPTYAPGLPLLMALATLAAGECGPYLVVPILGASTVWLTYRLGVRLGSHTWGLAAAILLAASPTFLWMLMWPMTDVPMTALLTATVLLLVPRTDAAETTTNHADSPPPGSATADTAAPIGSIAFRARARTLAAGLIMAIGVLVRPNLAPLAAVFALFILLRPRHRRDGLVDAALFTAAVFPGAIAVGIIQARLYGSPWRSGYGDFASLFAVKHVGTNLSQFGLWLLDTQTPLILAAIVPMWAARRAFSVRPGGSAAAGGSTRAATGLALLAAITIAVWLAYLFYLPFDHWSYLRFLMPSFPLLFILTCVGWQMLTARLPSNLRLVTRFGLFLIVASWELGWARNQPTFHQRDGESAYISAATYIDQHLPRNAMLVTMLHSGSVRYYTGRLTLRYDWIESEWWPRALDELQARGFRPYVLLPAWEEDAYRTRLGLPPGREAFGAVIAELRDPAVLRIYDPLTRPRSATNLDAPPPQAIPRVEPCPCPWQAGFNRAAGNPRAPE
jgi:4-amino-4-deoxy-L-arabinose transferase-like glycosyltransferase